MPEPTVFFVRGFANSGLENLKPLLDAHPSVACYSSLQLEFMEDARKNFAKFYSSNVTPNFHPRFRSKFHQFLLETIIEFCSKHHDLIGDFSPIGIGKLLIPNSKYIIISRDGRAVVVDAIKQLLYRASGNKQLLANHPFSNTLKEKLQYLESNASYFEEHKFALLTDKDLVQAIAKRWNTRIKNDYSIYMKSEEVKIRSFWITFQELVEHKQEIIKAIFLFLFDCSLVIDSVPNNSLQIDNESFTKDWDEYYDKSASKWFLEVANEGLELHQHFKKTILI